VEHTVVRVTEISLKLSVEELNTLTVAFGMTTDTERQANAECRGVNILDGDSGFNLFKSLDDLVQSVNE
jgi:hypothetical protein